MDNNVKDILNALSVSMSAEKVALAGIQSVIAAEISIARQKRKMSQKEFADFMGVSQGMISKWESGECNYTLETLVKIASKLNFKLQCPFAVEKPLRYTPVTSPNVISIDSYRRGVHTSFVDGKPYTAIQHSEDLKEM